MEFMLPKSPLINDCHSFHGSISRAFISVFFCTLLSISLLNAQQCTEATGVNGIAGTGHTPGNNVGQSFTACATGKLASVSAVSGNAPVGFNQVLVEIHAGEGFGGTLLGASPLIQVNANRTVTWDLRSLNIQVVEGQKYTAQFLLSQGNAQLKYSTAANPALDYYPGGRAINLGQAHNDMFFTAVIETLSDPVQTPEDDAVDVARSTEVKLSFSRPMEALTGNITINNVTDATSDVVNVTKLTIDGADVLMPLDIPLVGGKEFEIIVPANTLRSTNQIPFPGLAAGEWTFTTSTRPFATLSTSSEDLTNDAVFPFTIDFSDVVTGFALTDFVITNGTASNLGGSGDSFTFDITPTADGEVVISLPPDMVEAGTSNGNDSTGYSLVYDGTAPGVELRTAASGTIQTSVFDIEVVFDEPVSGFETSDLQLVNAEVLSSTNSKDSLFTITLRALAEGQITVDLPASIANDLAGNANTAAPANIDVTFSVDLESNLLSFYPFTGNANDTVSTGFNGTISGATLTTGFDGTTDGAYSFDGTDEITFGDTPIGTGSFTVAFWIKVPEGLPQNQLRTIIGKRAACSEGRFFEINYNNSSANGHQISVEQRNNAGVANPVANLSSVGGWTHIAYVKDNEQLQSSFFVNGVQQTPVAWTSAYNFENNASLKAGVSACNGSGRFRFTGDMDDIHVYGRALTEVEVDLLIPFVIQELSADSGSDIQAGQAIELTLNKNVVGSSANTTNITATGSISGSIVVNVVSTGNSVTINAPEGWPIDEDVTISLSNLLAENGTTLLTTDLTYSVIEDEAVGLILHYPISGNADEAIGTIAAQDGTVSGALFVEGPDGDPFGALSFDGVNDLVTLGDAPISTESFSISLLVKVPTNGSETANTIILSKREACSEGRMFDMSYMRSGDKVRFSASARNNASAGGVATDFDFPVDEWMKLTFVKDNSAQKYRLIVNGVLEAEGGWTLGTVNVENSAPIRLGNTPCNGADGTQRFNGQMDDIRVYDRVIEPRVLSIEPERGTVNAAIDTVITISFDRAIDAGNVQAADIDLKDGDDISYTFTTAFSNGDSVLTITPDNELLRGKEFTVTVDSLPVLIGSDFLPFETTFSTVSTQLLSFSPSNGEVKIDSLEKISFKFDNGMDMATLEDGIQIIGSHGGPVDGAFSMPATDSVVFAPTSPYFPNETITVVITPMLKDEGGESIGNNRSFKFQVKSGDFAGVTLSYELTQLTGASTTSPRILVPGDMDGDGDLDLIGGEDVPGTLLYFENLGSGNYSSAQIIDNNNGYFEVKITDFDLDGDADIVTADRSVSQGVYWYENDGSASFTEHQIVALPNSDTRALSVEDFNGDGTMDVAVASFGSNRLAVYESDGNQLFAAANVGGPLGVQAADINDDGDLDLFLANYTNGNVAQFSNSGFATFGGLALHSATHVRAVVPIDIDEDGDIDIVYSAQSANQIGVLENNGSGSFTNIQVGSVVGPHRIDVGDADGDGDFDILYTTAGAGADINFHYLENSGSLTLWVSQRLIPTATFSGTFSQTAQFADLDNDGDLDVAATDAGVGFYIFENKIIDLNEAPFVSNPISDQTIEEDAASGLTIDVSGVFVDNDGDSFTLSASSDNPAVTAIINGDDLEVNVVTADFNGDVNVTVTADDGMGTNGDTFVLSVTPVNDLPAFDLSATTLTVAEDFATTETITVIQNQPADEDAPTYSIVPTSSAVANVSINANSGEVTVTAIANAFGSEEFTVTADDGAAENSIATQTFTLTVSAVNDAPSVVNSLADVTADEDAEAFLVAEVTGAFTDVDGDALTYDVSDDFGGEVTVTLSGSNLSITPNPNFYGSGTITVTAEDASESVSESFALTISPVNDAPTFTTSGDLTLQTDFAGTETVTVTANEIPFGEDNQVVTYSLSPASVAFANVSIDASTGVVSVTAVASDAGTQEFTITADDGESQNNTATQTFALSVIDNEAPVVENSISDTMMDEDQAMLTIVDVTTIFSDPENDPMTYSVSNDFAGNVIVVINAGILEATPVANYFGSGTITLSANDGNQSTSTTFALTVNSINDAPTLSSEPLADVSINEDEVFALILSSSLFEDVEGDAIALSTNTLPSWLSFNGTTFSGTPANADVGTSTIEVIGDDGNGGTASRSFELTVVNVNDTPMVVSAVSDISVDEDAAAATIDLASVFEEVDAGDALSFTATTDNETLLNLSIENSVLTIAYASNSSGIASVTLTATDGSDTSVSDDFTITVNSVNDAPIFTLSETDVVQETNFAGVVTIDILAGTVPLDEAGQSVTYTIISEDPDVVSASINGNSVEITAITDASGEQTFTVTADDGQSENNVHSVTLTASVNRILSVGLAKQGLKVYPNPVVNTLMFDSSKELDIKVLSSDGRLLIHKKVIGSLSVENLKSGTYFIQANDGKEISRHRIIKTN